MEGYRVVVLLNSKKDAITEDSGHERRDETEEIEEIIKEADDLDKPDSSQANKFSPVKINLQVIDFKTLLVDFIELQNSNGPTTFITHKMSFDYVSYAFESFLNTEVSTLLDEMLLQRRSCCLMRFNPRRLFHLRFLYDLTAGIDSRIENLQYNIKSITVGYKNISNLNVRHILVNEPDKNIIENPNHNGNMENGLTLQNTEELRLWLTHDFRKLWMDAGDHDALNFNITIEGHRQNIFEVKLMLLNVHISKLDEDGKSKWHQYINHFGEREKESAFFYSPLTSWISKNLETDANSKCRTLLLFDVPTHPDDASATVDLLQMAHAVIKNRTSSNSYERKRNLLLRQFSNSMDSPDVVRTTPKGRGIKFIVPLVETETTKNTAATDEAYSTKDFNNLSIWYRKIDESFKITSEAMVQYFVEIFDMQRTKLLSQIIEFSSNKRTNHLEKVSNNIEPPKDEQPLNLKSACSVYYSSYDDFKCLKTRFKSERSFVDTMKIYYETKDFELSQLFVKLKINNLKRCQNAVNDIIGSVLDELQNKLIDQSIIDTNNN